MENTRVRNYAKEKKVNLWEVADRLKVCDTTLTKRLRRPLSEESEKEIIDIIDSIASKKGNL